MSYSRSNPSPRYTQLQSLYRAMHEKGETFLGVPPEKTFAGTSLRPQAERIKRLIEVTGACTILDYGSGKGSQYGPQKIVDGKGGEWPGIIDYWDADEVVCYDPAYAPYSNLPSGSFDGVICTDVLEHCPEDDIRWIVGEIFDFATRFVFASVACYPANKRLPNGENAHCTIRPAAWWRAVLDEASASRPQLTWEVWLDSWESGRHIQEKIGNS
jgi:hypothetical protein